MQGSFSQPVFLINFKTQFWEGSFRGRGGGVIPIGTGFFKILNEF